MQWVIIKTRIFLIAYYLSKRTSFYSVVSMAILLYYCIDLKGKIKCSGLL